MVCSKTLRFDGMWNFDFRTLLFHGVGEWLRYVRKAVVALVNVLYVLVFAIFSGIASIVYYFVCLLVRKILERPLLSVALVTVLYVVIFLASFMNMSYRNRTVEYQRDSVGMELYQYKKAYEDLIKYNKDISDSL